MLRSVILCCLVVLNSPSVVQADETLRWDPHVIVLATVGDLDSAREEAERASYLLDYGIDEWSLQTPEKPRTAEGLHLTVHRTGGDLFEIVCCLADRPNLAEDLDRAREFYPGARVRPEPSGIATLYRLYYRKGVIIAGSYHSYEAALRGAKALEAASGMPLGTRGLVYDENLGLVWPADPDDETSARPFYRRRYDWDCLPDPEDRMPCLTVEPSEAYAGFEPGHYIIVAGVLYRGRDRDQRLAAVRAFVPDAYVKETNLWMGCIH